MTRLSTSAAVSTTGKSCSHFWKGSKIDVVYQNLSTPFSYTFHPKIFRLLLLPFGFIICVNVYFLYTFLTLDLVNIRIFNKHLFKVLIIVLTPSKISSVRSYEEEAMVAHATLLDIEGKTEEAIATLETVNNMSSIWHLAQVSLVLLFPSLLPSTCVFNRFDSSLKCLALFSWQIYQRLSEEASNGVEETQDRCVTFLRKFRTYLLKIYNANADDVDKASSMSS